jgi:hypothetical protein
MNHATSAFLSCGGMDIKTSSLLFFKEDHPLTLESVFWSSCALGYFPASTFGIPLEQDCGHKTCL